MKRIAILLIGSLLLLCGCEAAPADNAPTTPSTGVGTQIPYYPPETIPVVVPLVERTEKGVKVTIHAGLLGNDSEVLSEDQIDKGFIAAVRNEDDSVTYTIATDRYDAFITDYRQMMYTSILSVSNSSDYTSVTSVACTPDLSAITLHIVREEYEYSSDGMVVFYVGLTAITEQAYDEAAPGRCVITVVDENGKQLSETIYPDELIL